MLTLVRRADENTVWVSNGIFRRHVPNPAALIDLQTMMVRHFHYPSEDVQVRVIDAGEDLDGVFGPDINAFSVDVEGPDVSSTS